MGYQWTSEQDQTILRITDNEKAAALTGHSVRACSFRRRKLLGLMPMLEPVRKVSKAQEDLYASCPVTKTGAWSEEEDLVVRDTSLALWEVAQRLGRGYQSVNQRARVLGVRRKFSPRRAGKKDVLAS